MESKIHQISKSVYAVIGPEGATNFGIVKATDGSAVLVDADIRRIDEVEEALRFTGCAKVGYLVNTHEHFDHTSANYFFEQRGVPIVASAGCVRAMREEGEPDFARMLRPVSELYERFPGLRLTLPDVVFPDSTTLTLPGITLHLKYCAENGHSHSKGDTTIYFEEEEILIAGDLLYTEVHPVTFFGNIPNWLTALKPLFQSHYKAAGSGTRAGSRRRTGGTSLFQKNVRLSRGFLRSPAGSEIGSEKRRRSRLAHVERPLCDLGQDAHGAEKHQSVSHGEMVLDAAIPDTTEDSWPHPHDTRAPTKSPFILL